MKGQTSIAWMIVLGSVVLALVGLSNHNYITDRDNRSHTAIVTNDGELWTTNTEREENVLSTLRTDNLGSGSRHSIVIDLSDNTTFPHDGTDRIDISSFDIAIDKSTNTLGSVQIGVVTGVNSTHLNAKYFKRIPFTKDASIQLNVVSNYAPSQLKAEVNEDGSTPFIITDFEENTNEVNSSSILESPNGGAAPEIGDIILLERHTGGGSFSTTIAVFYDGEPI